MLHVRVLARLRIAMIIVIILVKSLSNDSITISFLVIILSNELVEPT